MPDLETALEQERERASRAEEALEREADRRTEFEFKAEAELKEERERAEKIDERYVNCRAEFLEQVQRAENAETALAKERQRLVAELRENFERWAKAARQTEQDSKRRGATGDEAFHKGRRIAYEAVVVTLEELSTQPNTSAPDTPEEVGSSAGPIPSQAASQKPGDALGASAASSDTPERGEEYEKLVAEETLIFEATEAICERMEQDSGRTRTALADRLGRSKGYVTQILAGNRNMTLRTLARFASALDCRAEVKLISVPAPPGEKLPRTPTPVGAPSPIRAALKAARVRDGRWIKGAPTHVLAEFLEELEGDGWELRAVGAPSEASPSEPCELSGAEKVRLTDMAVRCDEMAEDAPNDWHQDEIEADAALLRKLRDSGRLSVTETEPAGEETVGYDPGNPNHNLRAFYSKPKPLSTEPPSEEKR